MSWRAYGLALLPLAAAGWLPGWATALLCVLYGLGVRWPRWEEGRLLLGLLVVGAAALSLAPAALAAGRAALVGLALHYLALSAVSLALHWTAGRISDGLQRSRTALLLPLLVGVLAPQPGLLLALAGGLLAVPGRDERMGRRPERPVSGVWWVVGAALGVVVLLALLLPRSPINWAALGGPMPPAVGTLPPVDQPAPPPLVQTPLAPTMPGLRLPFQFTLNNVFLPIDAILLGGLLMLLAGGGLMLRLRRREARNPHPVEVLMVAGLLLTGALWLVSGVLLSGGDGGGAGETAPPLARAGNALGGLLSNVTSQRQIDISAPVQLVLWLSLALLFALAAALFYLNLAQPREKEDGSKGPPRLEDSSTAQAQPALHRVRLAYRQAEALLQQHGRGRLAAETPSGYAARLCGLDPGLTGPLETLTRAYGPVRYGGRVTEDDAAGAEAAAQELSELLPGLPPPYDLPENSPDSLSPKENP
ncbi:DUF4129 domain-containing protein [Deinococcus arenicola]|uniref:DUF4129 domain-containing protein n=1 Tax=Deinococcus arenicola TaxID=2994950 RepID=A0ABU4DTF1_9DEIO|nr:DUF4129 domain-containing protein [Deinococcus sp. ZS9-10]MDV6375707.1 DUF4129 domain-containing protein [Deinococcus sp. ZS9-10]